MASLRIVKNRFVSYLSLIVGLLVVVFGLLALQEAGYLRSGAPLPAGRSDYKPVPQPDVGVGVSELDKCPVTGDDVVEGEDGSVLGTTDIAVGACESGAVGPLPREYGVKYYDSKEVKLVEGRDAADILGVICQAERELPTCGRDALACAWMNWSPRFVVHGLYGIAQRQPLLYALVDGFVRPDKGVSAGSPAPAIYPSAAAGKEVVGVYRFMNLWGLSPSDRGKLDVLQLQAAEDSLDNAEWHEGVHWAIFKRVTQEYLEAVNHPPVAGPADSPAALTSDVAAQLGATFDKIKKCEVQQHDWFHVFETFQRVSSNLQAGSRTFLCDRMPLENRKRVEAEVDSVKCS